jgi:multimeric flavodoxin WrbA
VSGTPGQEHPLILGIAGSPRRGGNSDRMLDEALKGAEAEGVRTDRIVVAQAGVNWCRGCNACSRDGVCIQRDGMDDIYPRLDAAAGFVVATPVFFASVPGVFKSFLDRLQPYWAMRYVLHRPEAELKRPAALLIAAAGGGPGGTGCTREPVVSAFGPLGVRIVTDVVAAADAADDIEHLPDSLLASRAAGGEIARRVLAASAT